PPSSPTGPAADCGPVGLYAHHAGSGHLHRCAAIARELNKRGVRTEILSSRDPGTGVHLPLDLHEPPTATTDASPNAAGAAGSDAADLLAAAPEAYVDPTAHGSLHWAPLGVPGYTQRMAAIAQWIQEHRPAAMYVDVSVEVAALCRLLGVPVITLAMPGSRQDGPHQLGYQQAHAILAGWPNWVPTPAHLHRWADKLAPVGGLTRFEGRPRPPRTATTTSTATGTAGATAPDDHRAPLITVLQGSGGDSWTEAYWEEVFRSHSAYRWQLLGGSRRVADPFPALCSSDLVIAAAGQNSVADIAAARVPAIFLPQHRPYEEQQATARLLQSAGLAHIVWDLPGATQWEPHLRAAWQLGESAQTGRGQGCEWERWQVSGATARAAEVIAQVANGGRPSGAMTAQAHTREPLTRSQPPVCIVTLATVSRADHLRRQHRSVQMFAQREVRHLCVALDSAAELRAALPETGDLEIVDLPTDPSDTGHGPSSIRLAAARNYAAEQAIDRVGRDGIVVFLDADCLASADLIERYASVVAGPKGTEDAGAAVVATGPVTYLTEEQTRGIASFLDDLSPNDASGEAERGTLAELQAAARRPHAARPQPGSGECWESTPEDYDVFWSLSFALTGRTWVHIRDRFGGFDEGFRGYGGEDTDFGFNLRREGIPLLWVGGADAYHQHHPISSPPWEHLSEIVENANRFYAKWGRWPMEGWLSAFERAGAVAFVAGDGTGRRGLTLKQRARD
ncbi:hypothetical protein, partial [Corynebacterium heidelbergense]|uniref:hypothetical protein n=1 Tax=Corynebacterium heidelbergense TaxID=2055947 RepID=UPI003082D6DB